MRVVLFYPSLLSDWNNATAHFLRGMAMEWLLGGHEVCVYEPRESGSLDALLEAHGHAPVARFHGAYPGLASRRYSAGTLDAGRALDGAQLVVVHELTAPDVVAALGEHRAERGGYRLLLHATLPRSVTAPASVAALDLHHYDGVLAGGSVIREQFLAEGWARRAWTWHEAADTRIFRPLPNGPCDGDVVWVGDWQTAGAELASSGALHEFLLGPVRELGLKARVFGAGYPPEAVALLASAGVEYGGWVPNFELPQVLARYKVVLHLPEPEAARRAPGLPTSRPFEALACRRPLACAVWDDIDHLFEPGVDFAVARDGDEMASNLRLLLNNPEMAEWLAHNGHRAVTRSHTCAHRVEALLDLCATLPEPVADVKVAAGALKRLPLAV